MTRTKKLTATERRTLQLKAATAAGLSQHLAPEVAGDTFDEMHTDATRRFAQRQAERRTEQ